jgi:hypothetical protein
MAHHVIQFLLGPYARDHYDDRERQHANLVNWRNFNQRPHEAKEIPLREDVTNRETFVQRLFHFILPGMTKPYDLNMRPPSYTAMMGIRVPGNEDLRAKMIDEYNREFVLNGFRYNSWPYGQNDMDLRNVYQTRESYHKNFVNPMIDKKWKR